MIEMISAIAFIRHSHSPRTAYWYYCLSLLLCCSLLAKHSLSH